MKISQEQKRFSGLAGIITGDIRSFNTRIAENQRKIRGGAAKSIKKTLSGDISTVLLKNIDDMVSKQYKLDDDVFEEMSVRIPFTGASINIGRDLIKSDDFGDMMKVGAWALDQGIKHDIFKLVKPQPYSVKGREVFKRVKEEVSEGKFFVKNKLVKRYKEDPDGEFKSTPEERAKKYCKTLNRNTEKFVDIINWNLFTRLLINLPINTTDNSISGSVSLEPIEPFVGHFNSKGYEIIRKANESVRDSLNGAKWIQAVNKQMNVAFEINTKLLEVFKSINIDKLINLKGDNLNFKQLRSIRIAYEKAMKEAEAIGYNKFWISLFLDFRGRLYQATKHLNYGSNKLVKSLFLISEGTIANYKWLSINAANLWGFDKESLKNRLAFAKKNIKKDWMLWASDPVKYIDEIAKAEDPFGFLAAIVEIRDYLNSDDKDNFISKLPIALDATNSGSQHLSLLSRDHIVGETVNLTRSTKRGDLYQYIADNCDLFETHQFWHKFKDERRKICKRPVMTYPYRCQARKMGYSIYDDFKSKKGFESLTLEYCLELSQQIFDTCVEKLPGVTALMDRFTELSLSFSKDGKQLRVEFPDGFVLQHNYYKFGSRQVDVFVGGSMIKARVIDFNKKKERKGKAETAPAANITHGWDSYYLRQVILNCPFPLALVHDSFACTSGNVDAMSRILRETAVEIYKVDQLKECMGIDDVKYGKLKVEEVIDNEFFVS